MSYTDQLYQLHRTDRQMDAIRKTLQEIEAALTETEALQSARKALQDAEAACKQASATVTDLDLEVKGLQQKIARHEKRLYSGKVTNPKEAASLQNEVASTKRWLAQREEALLEAMIALEEAEALLAERRQNLETLQSAWEAEQADLLARQQQQRAELERLSNERATLCQFVDEDNLQIYERLRRQKRGIAMAVVENGTCRSCGVMLSRRAIQQASAEDRLFYCDSCGRILHVL